MLPLEAVAVDAHTQPFRRMAAYNVSLQSEKANKEEKTHVCMNFTKKKLSCQSHFSRRRQTAAEIVSADHEGPPLPLPAATTFSPHAVIVVIEGQGTAGSSEL